MSRYLDILRQKNPEAYKRFQKDLKGGQKNLWQNESCWWQPQGGQGKTKWISRLEASQKKFAKNT